MSVPTEMELRRQYAGYDVDGDLMHLIHVSTVRELLTKQAAEIERLREDNQLLRRQNGSLTQQVIDREQERDQLIAKLSEEERAHGLTIDRRDKTEEHADRLAYGIGKALGIDIGEHSSMNCPWNNAFFAIDEFNITAHDADVIERFKDELVKSVSVMFRPHIEGVCAVVQRRFRTSAEEVKS